jgi:Putative DNA-binding domain
MKQTAAPPVASVAPAAAAHQLALQQSDLLQAITSATYPDTPNTTKSIANYSISTSEKHQKTHLVYSQRGVSTYRANAAAHAHAALSAAYPVLQQMLGVDTFKLLARDLWRAHPPVRGDLALWGEALAQMLQNAPLCADLTQEHPYLPGIAHIEWAMHASCALADSALDAASFAHLTAYAPEQLHLRLAPGAQLLSSHYPCAAIVQAHLTPSTASGEVDLSQVKALIAQGVGQTTLVWRDGFAPRLRAVPTAEAALLQATLDGSSLSLALDAALDLEPDFDFSAWLARSVQDASLLGVDVAA